MKIDRLLSIIILLLNRDKVNAEDLARKFEVTVRTIYRDMDVIGASGIPLVSYPGKNGGYGIREEFRIDRQVLGVEDLLSIMTALKGAHKGFDDKQTDKALEKIKSIIPKKDRDQLELKAGSVVFDALPWGDDGRFQELGQLIYKAIQESRLLEFDYTGWKEVKQRRCVEPMTLVFKGAAWYLFAFCRLRNDFRFFKISRIKEHSVLEEKFIPKKADYHQYMEWDENLSRGTEFRLHFSDKAISRAPEYFDPSQITTMPDGSIIVTAIYPDLDWVYSFFLSFGDGLEVLKPVEARNKLVNIAQQILNKYSK